MMLVAATGGSNPVVQFIVVLLIFAFVLALTVWTTKWIANYQKEKSVGENITILETKRIASNKYLMIVRMGDKVVSVAVGKDEISMICELNPDSITISERQNASVPVKWGKASFREFLERAREDTSGNEGRPDDGQGVGTDEDEKKD